jgi:hypothetical protein
MLDRIWFECHGKLGDMPTFDELNGQVERAISLCQSYSHQDPQSHLFDAYQAWMMAWRESPRFPGAADPTFVSQSRVQLMLQRDPCRWHTLRLRFRTSGRLQGMEPRRQISACSLQRDYATTSWRRTFARE